MKLCHTCENNDMVFSVSCNPEEAQWIKCEKLEPVPVDGTPRDCKISHPEKADLEIKLKQKDIPPGRKVLYWAANGKPISKAHEVTRAVYAYDRKGKKKFKNFGCTKVKSDGTIVMKLESPQSYIEREKLWAKHIHFIEEGEDNKWLKGNFYTVLGLPIDTEKMKTKCLKKGNVFVTPEQVRKNWRKGNFYMVYACSKKYPSLQDIKKYKDLNHIRFDSESKNIKVPSNIKKTTPLVIYGMKKNSLEAKHLMLKLAEKGYENLFFMEEGMYEFSEESLDLVQKDSKRESVSKAKAMASPL